MQPEIEDSLKAIRNPISYPVPLRFARAEWHLRPGRRVPSHPPATQEFGRRIRQSKVKGWPPCNHIGSSHPLENSIQKRWAEHPISVRTSRTTYLLIRLSN